MSIDNLRSEILDQFAASRTRLPAPFDTMTASALTPPRYASDWLVTFVDPGGFLDDYKRLAPGERSSDLLLEEPTGDVYWPSEYETRAGPVQFRCGFILHVVRSAPLSTELQVFELVPTAWVGEHWAMTAHGVGFGRYHDIRFVEPTVTERLAVLDLVDRMLTSDPARK
jgi:hypothetical protein